MPTVTENFDSPFSAGDPSDSLHQGTTDIEAFDSAFLQSALALAGRDGWRRFSLVEAARDADLPVEKVRRRYPLKSMVLLRLGKFADESALRDDGASGNLREHLFDLLMRRLDIFQEYRKGLQAVMQTLPYDPALAAFLTAATLDSMRWIADAAGIDCTGPGGFFRIHAVAAIWGRALRAWEKDESPDLSSTMAALDAALNRAERLNILKPSARRKLDEATQGGGGLPDHNLELES